MDAPPPGAAWIWPGHPTDLINAYAQFRRGFHVADPARPRRLWLTADQSYQLWINGRYVNRGPARGFAAHWPVDEYDLTPHLRPGRNWLSVLVHNPGVGTFSYQHLKAAGLLVWSSLPPGEPQTKAGPDNAADRGDDLLTTDASWRCRLDPSRARSTPPLSLQMGWQEHRDRRRDDDRWIHDPDFDPRAADPDAAGWGPPRQVRPVGSPPWHALEPRGLPPLTDDLRPYRRPVYRMQGPTSAPTDPAVSAHPTSRFLHDTADVAWQRIESPQTAESTDDAAATPPPTRVELPALADGQFAAVTLDHGQPTVGTLSYHLAGAAAGQVVDVIFCEALHDDGRPMIFEPRGSHGAIGLATRLVCAGSDPPHAPDAGESGETFPSLGHRYATLVTRGPCPALTLRLAVRETIYPLQVVGHFRCGDPTVNAIHDICVRTQRVCMLDAYVDTPWREQAQWWGDARVQSTNTFHLAHDPRLLERGIAQIGDPQQELPNGLPYGHAPTIAHDCVLPDFALTWMLTLADHHQQTADPRLYPRHRDRLRRMLAYFTTPGPGLADNGLLRHDPRYWLFLDWTPKLPRTGIPTLLNLWYLHTLQQLAGLADAAGRADDAEDYRQTFDDTRAAVDRLLWDPAADGYRDGLTAGPGDVWQPIDQHSLHNQVLAILTGLHPEAHEAMAHRRLLPYLQHDDTDGATPTSYWLTYLYAAAQQTGLADAALDHLVRHWSPMIPFGGTWERFDDPVGHSSATHAWSAHPIYHLAQILGGVHRAAPGWTHVVCRPLLDHPRYAEADLRVPTPHGLIDHRWQRRGTRAAGILSLPPGTTARLLLPGQPPRDAGPGDTPWSVDLPAPR